MYWLLKTEPGTFSFDDLVRSGKTNWNGVRNFQARNHLAQISPGDTALIYHSGDDRAVVGVARITRGAYPDPDPRKPGDWVQVDIEAVRPLKRAVGLPDIKARATLKDLPLIRQSRLSVMPITKDHYETLVRMGESAS